MTRGREDDARDQIEEAEAMHHVLADEAAESEVIPHVLYAQAQEAEAMQHVWAAKASRTCADDAVWATLHHPRHDAPAYNPNYKVAVDDPARHQAQQRPAEVVPDACCARAMPGLPRHRRDCWRRRLEHRLTGTATGPC